MKEKGLSNIMTKREEALAIIHGKGWYVKTSPEIQSRLESLGDGWVGYLTDLGARADIIGGLKVEAMADLLLGSFGCITKFKVIKPDGTEGSYEYFSWNKGPMSGAKGLVFLIDPKTLETTHFAFLEAEKFAAGGIQCVDMVGGFYDEVDEAAANKFMGNMLRELKEEFGAKSVDIHAIEDLGQYAPDYGMANNAPIIFAIWVKAGFKYSGINTDMAEVRSKVKIHPMADLKEEVLKISDGFFLACIAKLWAKDILS